MGKLTKKMVREAPRYMIAVDHLAGTCQYPYVYTLLEASNMLDAMTETESYHDETVYMIHLLEKTDDTDWEHGMVVYKSILCTRTKGNFHRADDQHSEFPFIAGYLPQCADMGWQFSCVFIDH